MKIHKYTDYEEYRTIQEEGNIRKIGSQFVTEDNIKLLSNYLKNHIPDIKFGICHGTRKGKEQEWFGKYLGVDVLGTEISKTAVKFPNTIQWDFHKVKEEWVESVDFIYSNSFDHSYDPVKCLDAWMSCIKENTGVCIIEWTRYHGEKFSNQLDPFGASVEELESMIVKKYKLIDKLEGKGDQENRRTINFIISK